MATKSMTSESPTAKKVKASPQFASKVGYKGATVGNIAKVGTLPTLVSENITTTKSTTGETVND